MTSVNRAVTFMRQRIHIASVALLLTMTMVACDMDGDNDLEMLEMAGTAVAVANCTPRVRAAADLVVASNDAAGVAEFFEAHIFASAPDAEGAGQRVDPGSR